MAASSICCVHLFPEENGPITLLSEDPFNKIVKCADEWKHLNRTEQAVAVELIGKVEKLESSDGHECTCSRSICSSTGASTSASCVSTCCDSSWACMQCMINNGYGYHRKCYQKFTNVTKIAARKKAFEKEQARAQVNQQSEDTEDVPSRRPKRQCTTVTSNLEYGSLSTLPNENQRKGFFPSKCIVCSGEKYVKLAHSRKRVREKLVQCQTFEAAENLRLAASKKGHQEMLISISNVDLIAKEAKYHHNCYLDYVRCLRTKPEPEEPVSGDKDRFDEFCSTVIVPRIINGSEVLRMNTLTRLFIDINKGDNQEFTYTNGKLKPRLQRRFAQLVFVKPQRRSCELVLCEFENAPRIIFDAKESSTETETETDADSDGETIITGDVAGSENVPTSDLEVEYEQEDIRTLYLAASFLKSTMEDTPSGIKNWPPSSNDLSDETISKTVPSALFNFLAWCTGESDEVSVNDCVTTSSEAKAKLYSLAQDIVYLASKGKKQTPKHYTLGMTIRHLSGSSKMIGLLNGLGHASSHTTVLELDTALAEKQIAQGDGIPEGIEEGKFSTLVWDNNDFGEETKSGHGTTHNTNGIIIQRSSKTSALPENSVTDQEVSMKRSRRRTVDAPEPDIKVYYGGKKVGPQQEFDLSMPSYDRDVTKRGRYLDMAYIMAKRRTPQTKSPILPGWTGFNTKLQTPNSLSTIGYLPIVDASPTEMATVNTVLLRSVAIADQLGLPSIVVVFDQAIYSKAQQIRWKDQMLSQRLVPRLGEFHTAMSFLGVIGKRFKDSGLQDILIESGTVAEGSMNGVLNGHHYNRCIRAHKLLFEALQRLCWDAFIDNIEDAETAISTQNLAEDLQCTYPSEEFITKAESEQLKDILEQYDAFVANSSQSNPTFQFWYSYIEMVQTLLLFIRATREGDWDLHLSSLRSMMPWFFAYDRMNYARYSPVYWLEMTNLEKTHPYVNEHLHKGEFVVQRQDVYGFSQIACDQTIEQTANRDSKTKGGLTGITVNKGAVHRWILSHPARAKISQRCEEMAGKSDILRIKKDLDSTRILGDEKAVEALISTIETMKNPFLCENDGLFNISSGLVANEDISKDLARAQEVGQIALSLFIETRLSSVKEPGDIDLFSPIKRQSLKTFSQAIKLTSSPDKLKNISLKESSDLLGRILMVSQVKDIDIKETLSYSLSAYPPALACYGGALVKTDKSSLRRHLEEDLSLEEKPPETGSMWIFDGMAFLQQLKGVPSTFEKLAEKVLRDIVSIGVKHGAKRVDFVTDCYPEQSIKGCERSRRSCSGVQNIKIMRGDQKTPKRFKRYLSSGTNKAALVHFFCQHWQKCNPDMLKGITVYLSHGNKCHSFTDTRDGWISMEAVHDLEADHEEADTRMLLHALHASTDFKDIVIRSADTDVFVLALACAQNVQANVYIHIGPWSNCRILAISAIASKLGNKVAEALVGYHCFTGCDSVSAFKGKGKFKGYKIMLDNEEYQDLFCSMGKDWGLEAIDMETVERFVCELYGNSKLKSVNDARYEIFRGSYKTDTTLPPNLDSLIHHTKRANYQAAIHRRCLETNIGAPNPVGNGWKMEDNNLTILWNSQPIAPDSILKSVSCSCKKTKCIQRNCSCLEAKIKCSELCHCINCENVPETNGNETSPAEEPRLNSDNESDFED